MTPREKDAVRKTLQLLESLHLDITNIKERQIEMNKTLIALSRRKK